MQADRGGLIASTGIVGWRGVAILVSGSARRDRSRLVRELVRAGAEPFSDDPEWLEIAASIIYLKNEDYEDEPINQVIGFLIEDLTFGYKNFEEEKVRKITANLMKFNLLK